MAEITDRFATGPVDSLLLGNRKNKSLSVLTCFSFHFPNGMKLFGLAAEFKGWETLYGFITVGVFLLVPPGSAAVTSVAPPSGGQRG